MLYSTGQIADLLHVSAPKVRQLINDGELKCTRMPMSGIARVNSEDFMEFCESRGIDPGRIKREGAYTVKTAAKIAGVSVPTVMKWIATGKLKSFGSGIGYCKVFPSELERFLKDPTTEARRKNARGS